MNNQQVQQIEAEMQKIHNLLAVAGIILSQVCLEHSFVLLS